MFKKILIANRGEIACRIMRTLKRMGIRSVAVYSEADEESLHVKMADEAHLLGPPPSQESYLNIQAILKVARESQAQAIHPGYGFLSENVGFAEVIHKEGLVFIGPSPKAIATMGDKLEAKKAALRAGVSCIPGTEEALKDFEKAEVSAQSIGYPLMIKAAAGGGGKGMRIVKNPATFEEALRGAINESRTSFGDGRVFLEKYIENPRHIEIQILADHHGHMIHLGERECSLQRRYQKVIEESPSPVMTPELREQMGEQALRLAKAVDYTSAGTVEFVMDPEGHFYFLEMNTRLQVEHPVTEMLTGVDLVEEMVRIAQGEKLRLQQSDVKLEGHAMEGRLYAEDPSRGFLPSIGRLQTYLPPIEEEGILRLESGVQEGDIITPYYDPLFAKLVVHQQDRKQACEALLRALNQFYIRGVSTNLNFLASLANAPFFQKGEFSASTLDELYTEGFIPLMPPDPIIAVGTAAVMFCIRHHLKTADLTIFIERDPHPVSLSSEKGRYEIKEGDETLIIETQWKPGDVLFEGIFNSHSLTLQVDSKGIMDKLFWSGYEVKSCVVDPHVAGFMDLMPIKEASELSKMVLAPMPGLVVEIAILEGEPIKVGQSLMIIEAMKMENIIRAQCDGIVEEIYVKKGDSVNLDQPLAKIG